MRQTMETQMKNLKSILLSFSFLVISACSGQPLFDPNAANSLNPPEGKLFFQISLETIGDHHEFQVGDYTVHLETAGFVVGNVSLLSVGVQTQGLHHEGEHPD